MIVRLEIAKINDSAYKRSKKKTLTKIGGPIAIIITFYKVNSNGNMIKDNSKHMTDFVFITEKFLRNDKLKKTHLKKIAHKAFYKLLRKSFFGILKIDKLI